MDKELLLKARVTDRALDIPGVGTIRVRGLSRAQALQVRTVRDDQEAMERLILRHGVVDPPLTEDDVREWYDAAPAGEIDPILELIQDLSGLSEGAPKRGVPGVRRGRGT